MRKYDRSLERREFLQIASAFSFLGYVAGAESREPLQYASVGMSSDTFAERQMFKLAQRYPCVAAVTKGNDPEEGWPAYYFITPNLGMLGDDKLSDAMCDLELSLYHNHGIHVHTSHWPVRVEEVDEESFLGDVIWQRRAA